MTNTDIKEPVLRSWEALNDHLINADEARCKELLQLEINGRKRRQFLLRIHSRLNKVRADRERLELLLVTHHQE